MDGRLVEDMLMVVSTVVWSALLYLTWLESVQKFLMLLVGLMVFIVMGIGFSADSQKREEERRRQERRYYTSPN